MIKTCPFCGAKAHVDYHDFGDRMERSYRVHCDGPLRHALDWWCDDPEEAIKVWNTRK